MLKYLQRLYCEELNACIIFVTLLKPKKSYNFLQTNGFTVFVIKLSGVRSNLINSFDRLFFLTTRIYIVRANQKNYVLID